MYQSELKELSKIKGGKKMISILLGSIVDISSIESPISPKWLLKYPSPTLTMNRVGVYGMKVNALCNCFNITAMVKAKNRNNIAKTSLER